MRIDLYTKTILTIIALLLGVIALRPFFAPPPALAEGMANIQFSGADADSFWLFDTRTGRAVHYLQNGGINHRITVTKLGEFGSSF